MPVSSRDLWIRWALLPVAACFLGLHAREVVRTGLWQPPVYAVPGATEDAHPRVGGDTLEVQGVEHGLEPGDVLVRVGSQDLRGHGYLGFMGHTYGQVDADGVAPLLIERDGQRIETELALTSYAVPWMRVPFLVLMWAIIAVASWRRPNDAVVQQTTLAFGVVIVGEAVFEGGSLVQTRIAKLVFIFAGAIWWPMILRMMTSFPKPPPSRLSMGTLAVVAASGMLWTLPKLQYLIGGPTPPEQIPTVVSAADALTVVIALSVLTQNYRTTDEASRRSLRWVVYMTSLASLLMVGALLLPVVAPGSGLFGLAVGAAGLAAAAIPLGFLVAVTAYDLFDIDRLISATAAYSLLLVGFLAVLLALVPAVTARAGPVFGFDAEAGRLFLSVLIAALVVPAAQWLRPRFDQLFFADHSRVEREMEALLVEQAQAVGVAELARTVARRVRDAFEPRFAQVFVRRSDAFLPESPSAGPAVEALPDGHTALRALGDAIRPLVLDPRQRTGLILEATAELPAPWLEADAALLLPIREGERLEAFVLVGRKRSGDVYTGSELTLLRASLQAASQHLDRALEAEAREVERRRAESIDRERRRVEAAHLMRSRHLAAASHDLRQPLHAIGLSAEALSGRLAEGEDRVVAERIRSSAASLHEMFDALIDLARLDQGTLPVAVRRLPLAPLLERLADDAEPVARSKGITIAWECSGELWGESDPMLLGRIVQNLVANAVRHTSEGSVWIRAEPSGDEIVVEVADTGPGIPADQHEQVFGEFVRLDAAGDTRGLGLGLSIVRRLAERLDHAIDLESETGKGTTFRVRVPRVAVPRDAAEALASPAGREGSFDGHRVLVADDDLDVLASVRALLESWGLRVLLASNIDEAVEACQPAPEVVLADYRLGGESGTDLVAAVRAVLGYEVPAIVITGSTSHEVFDEIAALGLPMLPKPLAAARLRAALAAALQPPRPSDG